MKEKNDEETKHIYSFNLSTDRRLNDRRNKQTKKTIHV